MTHCRGIRGATTARANTHEDMLHATRELLERMVARNGVAVEDIASVMFTVTEDLDAVYPALAARQLGWMDTALICAREIPVPDERVRRCIRVLMLVNTEKTAVQMRHVYLHEAVALRPDREDGGRLSAEDTEDAERAKDREKREELDELAESE
jgi:chorismate mutase